MSYTEEAYSKAVEVLKRCATPYGFFAAYPGYDAVWARDSMIISLGASLVKVPSFKETFAKSLITLAQHQSRLGQIPNAVDIFSKRKSHVDYASIDSTLWYIIGHYTYKKRYHDSSLFRRYRSSIQKALLWLSYQDVGEEGTLEQLPTTDWQDAFPHKYGRTINTQALYYRVLLLTGKDREAVILKNIINKDKGKGLWGGDFYLAWRWKNHQTYREQGEWFDSLGNILAMVFDLADKKQTIKILSYIRRMKIDLPYPVKAIYPPIRRGSKYWEDYFENCDARKPFHYLNGGIWPYIGGFYVLALVKDKRMKEARGQLEKLAEANTLLNRNFSEWLDGKTGRPCQGGNQGWNAGMYILAYHSVMENFCLL
ncbi:MAG: hypothetical protein COZ37_00795 [bacterium (Candidatus Ratteibacteria) CG_4_10_14_3_um_filter_41_18]|uniref:beta-fructofuranosidase n=4 Tax=Candidatus Ratteibacteria TaxID=2979319 RepID=A0A2M7YFY6_9BACT|nr:MAG: hypothetical protein COS11_00925 [bacterium (Candidatus Ratteibacteria) CG01_land_8_20_14_3_00_40_19]PIX77803.1 MAG: hypothetical protein COZ37_00795 [bacterium (Candidatus Ratteibacteria) CG_4_10_14_3_um_filter_41_18]PJA61876.1 MAG: hypothetical protein CO162_03995 [bacterium (Candidatus Ratteibacteria) CG_4_9_14_3_um_filter_41_21]